jgi:hypothetical protein
MLLAGLFIIFREFAILLRCLGPLQATHNHRIKVEIIFTKILFLV